MLPTFQTSLPPCLQYSFNLPHLDSGSYQPQMKAFACYIWFKGHMPWVIYHTSQPTSIYSIYFTFMYILMVLGTFSLHYMPFLSFSVFFCRAFSSICYIFLLEHSTGTSNVILPTPMCALCNLMWLLLNRLIILFLFYIRISFLLSDLLLTPV